MLLLGKKYLLPSSLYATLLVDNDRWRSRCKLTSVDWWSGALFYVVVTSGHSDCGLCCSPWSQESLQQLREIKNWF